MTRTSCRRVEALLALAAGDDLSPAEAAAVREHILACAACRQAAEGLAATVHTIRELPALRMPPEEGAALRRSVWKRIEATRAVDGAAAGRRGVAWKAAAWAAAGLVALLLLLPRRAAREAAPAGHAVASAGGSAATRDMALPSAIAPAPAPKPPDPESAVPRVARRSIPRLSRPVPESNEPVRIELSTPDPNVRIVWLVGSAGEDLPPLTDDFATATTKEDPE